MFFYNLLLRMKIIFILLVCINFSANYAIAEEKDGFDISAVNIMSSAKEVQWHGYYEFEYWDKENAKNTFDAHKITIWMGMPINDKVFISSEIEYEHFPRLEDSVTQRGGGSGKIKLDSAQLRITPFTHSAAYMGVFYVPFGIEYLSYPGHKNKLITRPKVMKSGGIIPGTWSDVGIGVNQAFPSVGQVDVYLINGDPNNGGISQDSSNEGNENKSVGVRLQLDGLVDGLNIGGSYVTGRWDGNDSNVSNRIGAHLRMHTDKIFGLNIAPVFIAEYVIGKDEKASSTTGKDKDVSGYYVQLSSRIHSLVELAARFGQYDNDEERADNKKTEISFGLVLHLLENFQIKGEYQINNEAESRKTNNNAGVIQFTAFW